MSRLCPQCGAPAPDNVANCEYCGAAIAPHPAPPQVQAQPQQTVYAQKKAGDDLNGQNKIVMILICLFLGYLGIHNFMMGETKKGVFKIIMTLCGAITCGVTSIISSVFVIIDLVKICMGSYVVDPNKLV